MPGFGWNVWKILLMHWNGNFRVSICSISGLKIIVFGIFVPLLSWLASLRLLVASMHLITRNDRFHTFVFSNPSFFPGWNGHTWVETLWRHFDPSHALQRMRFEPFFWVRSCYCYSYQFEMMRTFLHEKTSSFLEKPRQGEATSRSSRTAEMMGKDHG